jgi:Na+/melibiose symporter-like transporter
MNVPVALLGFVAVLALVPESAAPVRPSIDAVGVATFGAGLVGVTYGLIEAGQQGWGSMGALVPIAAGAGLIVAFFVWERALAARPQGQPLVDLELFRSSFFTWGVVLFAVLVMAMVGLLFIVPQYFQGVAGTTPEGSGVRLLPVVGGMMLGLLPAAKLTKAVGAKVTVSLGFFVLAAALALGASTTAGSGEGFVATWMVIAGAGVGLTMATAASAALSELPQDRAGVGSGVLQALKNTGAPLGSAILGSALSSGYIGRLRLGNIPRLDVPVVRSSLFGGLRVAEAIKSRALLLSLRAAFVHGMDDALLVSVGIAVLGLVLTLLFLPGRKEATVAQEGANGERAPLR